MTKCKVTRSNQSPMNAQRWDVTLACGNEAWVTRRKKPKIGVKVNCAACTPVGKPK